MATARAAQGEKRARTAKGQQVSEKVVEEVKVRRHRPGKAPENFDGADDDDGPTFFGSSASAAATKSDPRLERLMGAGRQRADPEVLEDSRGSRRRRDDDDDDDDDETAARARRRRRAEPEVLEDGD
eukprot:7382160-Prymnesium_polylepis.1